MDDLTEETGPLNPYARTFFSLWGLTVLLIVCFRLTNPTEQADQRIESLKTNLLKQGALVAGEVPGAERAFIQDKSPAQLRPLRTQPHRLTVRFCATEKRYNSH